MDNKRLISALAISLIILVGFNFIMAKYFPQQNRRSVMGIAPAARQQQAVLSEYVVEEMGVDQEKHPEVSDEEIETVLRDEEEIVFENDVYTIVFTDIGAGIKRITLNENPNEGLNVSYDVFNAEKRDDILCIFLKDSASGYLNNVKYAYRTSQNEVIFTSIHSEKIVLEKRYIFHNSLYLIELELTWKNTQGNDIASSYSVVVGTKLPAKQNMDERFFQILADVDGNPVKDRRHGSAYENRRRGNVNWVMLKNRYFAIIARPFSPPSSYVVRQGDDKTVLIAFDYDSNLVQSSSIIAQRFGIYIGPSNIDLVQATNIGIEKAVATGVFGSISQLLMSSLKFFHKLTGNWGISIIMLSFLINIVMFPLSRKSYKSMHQMQMMQPKIEKLRNENKSNPQKMQKEMMELYKKHKINPMGGCLPLLLQMPIFIALYQGLMRSIELRGANFLWITDLSMPENIKIPFTLPFIGDKINILPLLMMGAMFVQQKLTSRVTAMSQSDEQRQQQKMMTLMMTFLFGFIFYKFPSGLVLYWLTNTVVMSTQQFLMTRSPMHLETHD